ncbi:hypothetical protein [Stenomitos frigidus]|uniref:hypothetical protein n=1 Tax=Stenomitos frigidus TaxID=1886765 RepID=UPI0015E6F23B|nr:hypothetical protein [Stenomitos frigidus]
MATASTSYLLTLPKDEAIAFVASLQTVQNHLSQALLRLGNAGTAKDRATSRH